jgi:hypothetical protein
MCQPRFPTQIFTLLDPAILGVYVVALAATATITWLPGWFWIESR